jgi:hypothetical protein
LEHRQQDSPALGDLDDLVGDVSIDRHEGFSLSGLHLGEVVRLELDVRERPGKEGDGRSLSVAANLTSRGQEASARASTYGAKQRNLPSVERLRLFLRGQRRESKSECRELHSERADGYMVRVSKSRQIKSELRAMTVQDLRVGLRRELERTQGGVGEKRESKVLVLRDEHGRLLVRVNVEVSDGLCARRSGKRIGESAESSE